MLELRQFDGMQLILIEPPTRPGVRGHPAFFFAPSTVDYFAISGAERSFPYGFWARMGTGTHSPYVLSQSTLGINGRFGNQLFQYAFQQILARQLGMKAQTSTWTGRELFGHCDPLVNATFPLCAEGREFEEAIFPAKLFQQPSRSFDLFGYFQFHTSHYAPFRETFCSLFRPKTSIEKPLKDAVDRIRNQPGTLVGLHLRRGDFGCVPFFIAPNSWYLHFLRQIWPTLNNPVLFIASDEPHKVVGDFSEFSPFTSQSLGLHIPAATFYPDFYLLTQCDLLAISNSTFSFAAAMLNQRARVFQRPDLLAKQLVPFDPWNSLPLLHRELSKPLSVSISEMEKVVS
jgi:hypothetical protein